MSVNAFISALLHKERKMLNITKIKQIQVLLTVAKDMVLEQQNLTDKLSADQIEYRYTARMIDDIDSCLQRIDRILTNENNFFNFDHHRIGIGNI